jgi:hypothetical protein
VIVAKYEKDRMGQQGRCRFAEKKATDIMKVLRNSRKYMKYWRA